MSKLYLSQFLSDRAKKLDLSATEICKRSHISRQTWYRLINADFKHIRLDTLSAIANILDVSLVDLSFMYIRELKLGHTILQSRVSIQDQPPYLAHEHTSSLTTKLNELFEYQWTLSNNTNHCWKSCKLVCLDDELTTIQHSAAKKNRIQQNYTALHPLLREIEIPITPTGEKVVVSCYFKAPAFSGDTLSLWQLVDTSDEKWLTDPPTLSCHIYVSNSPVLLPRNESSFLK